MRLVLCLVIAIRQHRERDLENYICIYKATNSPEFQMVVLSYVTCDTFKVH